MSTRGGGGLGPGDVDSEGVVALLRGDSVSWWYACRLCETERSPSQTAGMKPGQPQDEAAIS